MSEDIYSHISADEYLGALRPYQRDTILELIKVHGDEEEAAKQWLSAKGASNISTFGGSPAPSKKPFWDLVLKEFRAFVCGAEKYKEERQKLLDAGKPTAFVVVSIISGALATSLGIAASVIAPVVAILLSIMGKIGVNAWCAVNDETSGELSSGS